MLQEPELDIKTILRNQKKKSYEKPMTNMDLGSFDKPSVAGMRALEACLFMAGDDSSGIGVERQSDNPQ